MKKLILTSKYLILLTLVTSCSIIPSQTKPVEIVTIAKPAPLYHPPLPMELQLVDIDWEVLTPELMAEYLKLVESGNAPRQAYYALSTKDYENLSVNTAEQKRYIKQVLSIIEYYRELDKQEKEDENIGRGKKSN